MFKTILPADRRTAEVIMAALEDRLGDVRDNLFRAEAHFSHYTAEAMRREYGQSRQTPEEILSDYRSRVKEVQTAMAWLQQFRE